MVAKTLLKFGKIFFILFKSPKLLQTKAKNIQNPIEGRYKYRNALGLIKGIILATGRRATKNQNIAKEICLEYLDILIPAIIIKITKAAGIRRDQ
jgi:hypothetical protein